MSIIHLQQKTKQEKKQGENSEKQEPGKGAFHYHVRKMDGIEDFYLISHLGSGRDRNFISGKIIPSFRGIGDKCHER